MMLGQQISGHSFCSDHQATFRFTQLGQYCFYKYPIFQDCVFSCIRENPSEESIRLGSPSPWPLVWVVKKASEISLLALTF